MIAIEQIVYYIVDNYVPFLAGSLVSDALSFASERIYEKPESVNIPLVVKTVNYLDAHQQAPVNEMLSYIDTLTELDLLDSEKLLDQKEQKLSTPEDKPKIKVKCNNEGGNE